MAQAINYSADSNPYQPIRLLKEKHLIMIRRLFLWAFLSVTFCLSACHKQEAIPLKNCPNAGDFVRQANNLIGTVFYDSTQGRYGIQVATSFDSADMGYTCNLPADYQKELLKVRFSGSFYAYDKPVKAPAGYRVYYLTLESITR